MARRHPRPTKPKASLAGGNDAPSRSPRWTTALQRRWLAAWMVTAAGVLTLLSFTRGLGLGITPDSVSYLSAADSLVHGKGLLDFDNEIFSAWPPLLPLLLAAARTVTGKADTVAWIAQIVLYGGTLAFLVAWSIRRGSSPWVSWPLAAALVLAYPPLRVASTLWSELLFSALSLLALERLVASRHRDSSRAFWIAVAASAAAALTRYIGVALILTGFVYLLVTWPGSRAVRLRRALLFTVIAAIPLGLWALRNLQLGEGLTGPRHPALLDTGQILSFLGHPLPRLFLGESPSSLLPDAAWLALFVLLWSAMFVWSRRWRRHARSATDAQARDDAFILLLFIGIFFGTLAVAVSRSAMDRPNLRLLAPMVWPTLMVPALIASSFEEGRRHRIGRCCTVAALVLIALAGALQFPGHLRDFRRHDAVYALPRWRHSALAARIRETHLEERLLSNRPDTLFYLCGIRVPWTPREKAYNSHDLSIQYRELKRFERRVKAQGPGSGLYIAWFDENPHFLLELSTLRNFYQVMEVAERLDDGLILFVPYFEGTVLAGPPPG